MLISSGADGFSLPRFCRKILKNIGILDRRTILIREFDETFALYPTTPNKSNWRNEMNAKAEQLLVASRTSFSRRVITELDGAHSEIVIEPDREGTALNYAAWWMKHHLNGRLVYNPLGTEFGLYPYYDTEAHVVGLSHGSIRRGQLDESFFHELAHMYVEGEKAEGRTNFFNSIFKVDEKNIPGTSAYNHYVTVGELVSYSLELADLIHEYDEEKTKPHPSEEILKDLLGRINQSSAKAEDVSNIIVTHFHDYETHIRAKGSQEFLSFGVDGGEDPASWKGIEILYNSGVFIGGFFVSPSSRLGKLAEIIDGGKLSPSEKSKAEFEMRSLLIVEGQRGVQLSQRLALQFAEIHILSEQPRPNLSVLREKILDFSLLKEYLPGIVSFRERLKELRHHLSGI